MTADYRQKVDELLRSWPGRGGPLRLQKSTASNLFRYQPREAPRRQISLAGFNRVIALDAEARTLEVEGLATFESIVAHSLPRGWLPLVTPELRHITIGGATVGIGIESTGFRHGFVHDGLIEADVLLPGGEVVTCRADNEHADLFHALPNSYGTLGYILRAKIALHRAAPFVHLQILQFGDAAVYLAAMREATQRDDVQFIEGLFFEDRRFFLMLGRYREQVPVTDDILRKNIFYKLVQARTDIYLTTEDYIFRYDPEWFWNIPDTWPYALFRRFAPQRYRNSGFYTRHMARQQEKRERAGISERPTEPLIQDWEVPWRHAGELVGYALEHVKLDGRPWAALPIRALAQPTLYPVTTGELYFNLGSYCQVRRPESRAPYHYTRIMDRKCFELGGIKMLYSSSFLEETEFDERYNGAAYRELKQKYDPHGDAPALFEKVAQPKSGRDSRLN